MAKTNPSTRKSEQVQIAKISAVQAIIVALIAAVATAIPVYFAGRQMGKGSTVVGPTPTPEGLPPNQSVRLINNEDLGKLMKNAQIRVWAAGYALDPINPQVLAEKIKENRDFEVKLVLVDPNSKVVCQRDADGGSKTPGYEKLTENIDRINRYREGLPEERYKVKLSSRYPMMAVYIIDNHVYAHFFPFTASGATSPVLELAQGDKNAEFFMNHFRAISEDKDSQSLPTKIEYGENDPCQVIKPRK